MHPDAASPLTDCSVCPVSAVDAKRTRAMCTPDLSFLRTRGADSQLVQRELPTQKQDKDGQLGERGSMCKCRRASPGLRGSLLLTGCASLDPSAATCHGATGASIGKHSTLRSFVSTHNRSRQNTCTPPGSADEALTSAASSCRRNVSSALRSVKHS